MKKYAAAFVFVLMILLSSCASVVIPTYDEAKEKMTSLGYEAFESAILGEDAGRMGIEQERTIIFKKDGEMRLFVYYFKNEKDCDTYYERRKSTLESADGVKKKNKYSIYTGYSDAIDDFLS